MAFTEQESTIADLLAANLISAAGGFEDTFKAIAGQGISGRVALLAAARVLASIADERGKALPPGTGQRELDALQEKILALTAKQISAYIMTGSKEYDPEDLPVLNALALDDSDLTAEFLGESPEPCSDCGEYHAEDKHGASKIVLPS